jgi:hypothetical protein
MDPECIQKLLVSSWASSFELFFQSWTRGVFCCWTWMLFFVAVVVVVIWIFYFVKVNIINPNLINKCIRLCFQSVYTVLFIWVCFPFIVTIPIFMYVIIS